MLNIGPQELLVVLIIALLVVGPHRLPELSRQLGRGLREFRKIQDDVKGMVNLDEVKDMVRFDTDPATPAPRAIPSASVAEGAVPGVHRAARPAPTAAPAATPDDEVPT